MRILVTGTAGFIGFHVAKKLLEMGHEVIGADNLNDYYSPQIKEERHRLLKAAPNFTEVRADISDRPAIAHVFAAHEPELVCNLAAQAGVRYSLINPDAYIKSNIIGFHNIIEECLVHEVRRLVYASSSSVYGGNTKLPFSEEDRVDHPISLYAATKRSNEVVAHAYSHLHSLPTVGLRYFTVYGPLGRPDMAIWQFAQHMLRGEPIEVYNYGKMQRDFTYIDDIVSGTVAALLSDKLGMYELFNVGNHKPVELMHVIELLEKGLGVTAGKNMMPIQPGDVPATYADIARAREKLGFEPTTSIEDGIAKFLHWIKENEALFLETTFAR